MPLEQNTDRVSKENAISVLQPDLLQTNQIKIKKKQVTIWGLLVQYTALKGKLIWCLDTVHSNRHCSFQSSNSKLDHFTAVFPDRKIPYEFSSGKTNCGYLIAHMLAPHFKQLLLCAVNTLGYFICPFDESFNRIFMKGQMKLHV